MSLYLKKQSILALVLQYINFYPYDKTFFDLILKKLKLDQSVFDLLFPQGIYDFNSFVIEEINKEFIESLKNYSFSDKKTHEKITLLLQIKITILQKYKILLKEIIAETTFNPLKASLSLWNASNQIWNIIHDHSTDFNYYTKRFSLSIIYFKVLFFFISDSSESSIETKEYITREINRMIQFIKFKHKTQVSNLPILRYLTRKTLYSQMI